MDLLDAQPEFTKSFWDYLDILVNEDRIQNGRAILAQHRASFDAVEKAYGVVATSSPRSGASNPITARRSASGR
jgi:membrane-bound lytic murein transglycosylase B